MSKRCLKLAYLWLTDGGLFASWHDMSNTDERAGSLARPTWTSCHSAREPPIIMPVLPKCSGFKQTAHCHGLQGSWGGRHVAPLVRWIFCLIVFGFFSLYFTSSHSGLTSL